MKTVLVTGASRGIGRSIALKFAREGRNVVINSRTGGRKLEEVRELIQKNQKMSDNGMAPGCLAIAGDVSDSAFVQRMFEQALEVFGDVDILVNNAGVSHIGLIQDLSDEDWNRLLSTNLSSVHYCCRAAIPGMLRQKSGRIINISSVWGNVGASCEVAYSATKGGVNSYTRALAKELAPSGIAVNAIACGVIDTDMNRCFSDEEMAALCEEIPAGRAASPDEVAELVYSLSESPAYLTGQIITFDGGWQ